MDGVHEEAAVFGVDDLLVATPFAGAKRFCTFGDCGPMYEVMAIDADRVRVWLSNSAEETTIRLADALDDPQAR